MIFTNDYNIHSQNGLTQPFHTQYVPTSSANSNQFNPNIQQQQHFVNLDNQQQTHHTLNQQQQMQKTQTQTQQQINNLQNNKKYLPIHEILLYWKKFNFENLKNDLNIYIKEVNSQTNTHADLVVQSKQVQRILSVLSTLITTQNIDDSSSIAVLESFQNQLTHLQNRIKMTEDLVLKLAKFFNTLIDSDPANMPAINIKAPNKRNRKPMDPTNTLKPKKTYKKGPKKTNSSYTLKPNESVNLDAVSQVTDYGSVNLNNYSALNQLDNYSAQIVKNINLLNENQLQDEEIENTLTGGEYPSTYQSGYVMPYNLNDFQIPEHETTEQIALKLKKFMIVNKVSQRNLAENLLNMKQANLSALLSQPMCWDKLSKISKDRFLIMYLWLNDPDRMEKLGNGPRTKLTLVSSVPAPGQKDKYAMGLNTNHLRVLNSSFDKKRVVLNQEQTARLKYYFMKSPYPSSEEVELIACELNLAIKKISAWFIHQRQLNKHLIQRKT